MDHLNKNNYYSKSFELYESDGRTPLDCSEITVKFIVKKSKNDSDAVAVLPIRACINSETHRFLFEFTAEETQYLSEGQYIQALKIYREDGKNEEIWVGQLSVEKGVFYE